MNTKFIGIKEFRQNMAMYAKQARSRTSRFVVVNRNTPIFAIEPFDEDATLESYVDSILAAKEEVIRGEVFSSDQVHSMLTAQK